MKKTITIALLLVLTVCLLAGCRRGNDAESMITDASQAIDDMMPSSDSGAATDHDGFIGENNSTGSTTGSTNGDTNGGNSGSTGGGTNGGSNGNTNDGTNGSANGGTNDGTNGGTNGGINDGTNNGNGARSGGFLPIHY